MGILRLEPRKGYDSLLNYRLRFARVAAGYSLRELARASGVSYLCLAQYESLRDYPPEDAREKIASVLGKKPDEIFPKNCYGKPKPQQDSFVSLDDIEEPAVPRPDVSRQIADIIKEELLRQADQGSPAQRIIIYERLAGKAYREIGEALNITGETVRQHWENIAADVRYSLRDVIPANGETCDRHNSANIDRRIDYIASKLDLQVSTVSNAKHIGRIVGGRIRLSKNVAPAAVYIALMQQGVIVTQARLAAITGTNVNAIYNKVETLKKALEQARYIWHSR